jgi:hypothetical protein
MKSQYERELERVVDRVLKKLPEFEAPKSMVRNVTAALQARAATPWYRKPWQTWSLPLQVACLGLLFGAFGGLCFGVIQLTELEGLSELVEELAHWKGGLFAVFHVLEVLTQSAFLIFKQLGTGVMLGCLAALGISYAACIGLGTLWVRLAWIKR